MSAASINDALKRVQANSPFLSGLIDRNADLMPLIHAGNFDEALNMALARSAESVGTALRKQRQGVALVTAIADLAGIWNLGCVTRILSDFADHALDQAIAAAIAEAGAGDIVLVAGKGHEQGQIVGRGEAMRVLPFDDVQVARECSQ
jgi:glutamine synthetase adenylyltransferase